MWWDCWGTRLTRVQANSGPPLDAAVAGQVPLGYSTAKTPTGPSSYSGRYTRSLVSPRTITVARAKRRREEMSKLLPSAVTQQSWLLNQHRSTEYQINTQLVSVYWGR